LVGINLSKETEMSDNKEVVKVKADIYWAFLDRKNEMADAYTVDLCNLSDAAVAALEGMGISVQENAQKKPEQGRYITCKSQRPILAFDNDGKEIEQDVGNGSKCKAMIGTYPWTYKNKKGISPTLKKLVITDLVVFEGAAAGIDDDDVL
jgi:hypothetical protein